MRVQWKMNENSLFAILLRSAWWMSAAIAAAIVGLAVALLPETWRVFGLFLAVPFAGIAGVVLWRRLRAPSGRRVASTLDAVRAMSWPEFAEALEHGFRRDGYEVSRLGSAAADFEIVKGGRRALVSGKRWKVARTGVEPLKELVGAREAREAHESIYVLAGELTDNARTYAAQKRIRLIGGAELAKMLPDAVRGKPRGEAARGPAR
jgi:restriction system protein